MKKILICLLVISLLFVSNAFAAITQQQGDDVAEFAKKFIEEGNNRRDEKGFPLLTYALSGNWKTCIQIRSGGYNAQMYHVKNNGYYIVNGRYLDLGEKWVMDCGTTVLFLLKNTLGFELLNSQGEPWHVQDIYNDARKGKNSQYFDMVYSGVSVGRIDYSKLQKGDIIAYITDHGNHGMLYLGDGYIAHANRDMIRSYGNNKISGFQVNKLNRYFLSGTVVRVMRIKDGIIPEDLVVNGVVTWPDTGETVDLLNRTYDMAQVEEIIDQSKDSNGEQGNVIIPEYTLEDLIKMQENSYAAKANSDYLKRIVALQETAKSTVMKKLNNRFISSQLDIETSIKPMYHYSQYIDSNSNIELAKISKMVA
jgi:hypothetical protein